jgi:hypothetical protein
MISMLQGGMYIPYHDTKYHCTAISDLPHWALEIMGRLIML